MLVRNLILEICAQDGKKYCQVFHIVKLNYNFINKEIKLSRVTLTIVGRAKSSMNININFYILLRQFMQIWYTSDCLINN